jgi:hypothetical protein
MQCSSISDIGLRRVLGVIDCWMQLIYYDELAGQRNEDTETIALSENTL